MKEISYQSLVWLSYRLGATFAFGLPLVLLIWASIKKETAILRLLSIYWKVSSLMLISMLLLTGNRAIGYFTTFLSAILVVISLWFWIDINEEINQLPEFRALPSVLKIWRWALSIFSCFYSVISFISINCLNDIQHDSCIFWVESTSELNQIIKNTFNFLFGAQWTTTLSALIGYLALIIYIVGFIQWIFIRLPKQGRIAGGL